MGFGWLFQQEEDWQSSARDVTKQDIKAGYLTPVELHSFHTLGMDEQASFHYHFHLSCWLLWYNKELALAN